MRLNIKKVKGSYEASVETKYGEIDLRHFFKIKVEPHKQPHSGVRLRERNFTDILNEADVDHAQYYMYMKKKSGVTMAMLRLLDALGYELRIVKKEQT